MQPLNSSSLSMDPPFTLPQLHAAVPASCFEPSAIRSLRYFGIDVILLASLYAIEGVIDSWLLWPFFCFAQGTLFWAIFVVGHDCGHGSFSEHRWLNRLVGYLAHTPLLIPFDSWRISHRIHHTHVGDIDADETWHPVTETQYAAMSKVNRVARLDLFLLMLPFYLLRRTYGRRGSHYHPGSDLFQPSERSSVRLSILLCGMMLLFLFLLAYYEGPLFVVKFYFAPWLVFVIWADLVTYLHHTDPDVPWYRGSSWSFLKGALSTIDRDYGFVEPLHHGAGSHLVHHLFPRIPHYHLPRATQAIQPVLGDWYRKSDLPIWKAFLRSFRNCRVVPDEGEVVQFSR